MKPVMTNLTSVRVVVLGSKHVGKTALIVRFLTQRYIGEYRSNIDWLYKHSVTCDDSVTEVEILDISRWSDDFLPTDGVQWADACVVIYSICDRKSFVKAHDYLDVIYRTKAPHYTPVVLLGNKRDLELGRQVSFEDGSELSTQYGCDFDEVSAADNYVRVNEAFCSLIRQVRTSQLQQSLVRQRKRSIMTVTKMLSAMFGKHSNKNVRKNTQPSCSL
ncbi:ras-related and estrogen-regulated growth inhibitor-like [Limulus polyphemus]|uniref:small monomeric GTPase n=1 Tax=Limulus polyphemus TaxID=6850 RepID=A0ABM1S5W3_LIMPO|nr:ras-related and estrogen-regulated growth inhibitor-like [Limulus polyphemus]